MKQMGVALRTGKSESCVFLATVSIERNPEILMSPHIWTELTFSLVDKPS